MTKNIDQKMYADMARKILSVVPHVMTLYNEKSRNDFFVVHRVDNFEFRLIQMHGHLSFSYLNSMTSDSHEVFSIHLSTTDTICGWDGTYGYRSYKPNKFISLYDHYDALGGFISGDLAKDYAELNKISDAIAKEMFPKFYEFTLTEEEHFQKSLIYDLMSYEDMKMWHDVITSCPEIDDGIVFFSFHYPEMFDHISTAIVNMEALQKRSYE